MKAAHKRRQADEAEFLVFPANWSTVLLFLDMQTQWRTAGQEGAFIGLDYGVLDTVARSREVMISRQMFEGLQVMEATALQRLNERLAEQ